MPRQRIKKQKQLSQTWMLARAAQCPAIRQKHIASIASPPAQKIRNAPTGQHSARSEAPAGLCGHDLLDDDTNYGRSCTEPRLECRPKARICALRTWAGSSGTRHEPPTKSQKLDLSALAAGLTTARCIANKNPKNTCFDLICSVQWAG